MDPVRTYGDALAMVTVTRTSAAPDGLLASLPAATVRPVQVVHADTGGAPSAAGAVAVRIAEDVGRPAAVNRAVAALPPDVGWVVLADPQLEWRAGALDELLDVAVRYPRAGAVGPRLHGPSGTLSTTCVLLRRMAWDSVDGFDGRYRDRGVDPEPPDLDLCDRLGRAGWLCVAVSRGGGVAGVTVIATRPMGMLEPHRRGLRRYRSCTN